MTRIGWQSAGRIDEITRILNQRIESWSREWEMGYPNETPLSIAYSDPDVTWNRREMVLDGVAIRICYPRDFAEELGARALKMKQAHNAPICGIVGQRSFDALCNRLLGGDYAADVDSTPVRDDFVGRVGGVSLTSVEPGLPIAISVNRGWCEKNVPDSRENSGFRSPLLSRHVAVADVPIFVSATLLLGEIELSDSLCLRIGEILVAEGGGAIQLTLGPAGKSIAQGSLVQRSGDRLIEVESVVHNKGGTRGNHE